MPGRFCHSCTAPLDVPQFKSAAKDYCIHCVDESGKLLSRDAVQDGIAHWFMSWQGGVSANVAHERAGHFMKAMPAWAAKTTARAAATKKPPRPAAKSKPASKRAKSTKK